MAMRTLADLAEHTGLSKSYWYKRTAGRGIHFTKVGGKIRFTDAQWDATLALFEEGPKVVPTRDEVAAKRAGALGRGARRVA